MFPFWDVAIAPVFDAVRAKRVVEIGALRGDTTVLMLDRLGPDAELHVIDPKPQFDPEEHERQFPGRYIFHRDLSLEALRHLPPVDIALIDGDHNWYTVYHELKLIADTARGAGAPMPVMILHDVCWPYGRRDLYYAPDTIPEDFRQPYAQQGIRMDREKTLPNGGLNPTMNNAIMEGGPRNGVMTAVDDFMAEYDRPLHLIVLPAYFGLALIVEEERLTAEPDLARVFQQLEAGDKQYELLEMAEGTRLRAMLFQHNVFFHRERMLADTSNRYLDLLKGALLDEHYLENEVRIDHLLDCTARGAQPVANMMRDPSRWMKDKMQRLRAARQTGALPADPFGEEEEPGLPGDELRPLAVDYFPYTTMGRTRLDHLHACLDAVRTESVEGDLVECGTGRGGGAVFLRAYLEAWKWILKEQQVFVADRFAPALEPADVTALDPDLNMVRDAFDRFDLLDDRVRFLQGEPAATLPDAPIDKIAVLRIGTGGDPAATLDALYDRVSIGGHVIVDQYRDPDTAAAVDSFRSRRGVPETLERVDWASVSWCKQTEAAPAAPEPVPAQHAARAPLAPPAPTAPKDLTVVVVFYNMRREAERTLHSLSRAYQQDIDDLDYEVIVVENGSSDDQKLGAEWVAGFGPEFRYLDLGDDADPSPVRALNRGVAAGAGTAFALMIDGAHVLTPRVLRFGMTGLDTYQPAVVLTQQWYMGPGQQGEAMLDGYDQGYEDRLFASIGWPTDGYRLFDIGHFIGDRDWLDGMWESNCLFAPRSLLEQVGSFDESFSMPGGGYANLDLFERLASDPDVTLTTILGEGSFHQVHGGTTTNQPDIAERNRRIGSYAAHYADIRGRGFRGPDKRMHYVGTMFWEALRTRARRRVAPNFFKDGAPGDLDGFPESPIPIPEDLQIEYTDAFWRSLRWRGATWLGHTVAKSPTDLFTLQEMINNVRPDWIVEVARGVSGRSLFLASICELLGHGQVLVIDDKPQDDRIQHPRLTYLSGTTFEPDTVEKAREIVGDPPNALVIIGTRGRRLRIVKEFEAYSPLVPVGSYVVVEDTIVNGHPVWASFGLGPAEAVKQILAENREFAADTKVERYTMSFNPGGFLKRVR